MNILTNQINIISLELSGILDKFKTALILFRALPVHEKIFTALLSIYLIMLHLFMKGFAIMAIPLPFLFRQIYVTEILLVVLFLVFTFGKITAWKGGEKINLYFRSNWFGFLICGLVLFSIVRVFTDHPPGIEDGFRNICFSYYLLFSLMIAYFVSESSRKLLMTLFVLFLFHDLQTTLVSLIKNTIDVYLSGSPVILQIRPTLLNYGVLAAVYFSFQKSNSKVVNLFRYLCILIVSLLFAYFLSVIMNRTLMIGILLAFAMTALFTYRDFLNYLKIFLVYATLIGFMAFFLFPTQYFKFHDSSVKKIDALKKLDHTGTRINGMEGFRWAMWTDAWVKFLKHPYLGIGLGEQVVHRVYVGYRIYVPGTGYNNNEYGEGPEKGYYTPNTSEGLTRLEGMSAPFIPISGPHNSFLNILARFGIFYFIGFMILMCGSLNNLRQKNLFLFFTLTGLIMFALFNVAMENPQRGMYFYILLGIGLSYYRDSRKV